MTLLRRAAPAIWVLALICINTNEIAADDFRLIPSLSLRGEFNDNLFFSERDEEEDYIATVSPGLKIIDRTERIDFNLSARGDVIEYDDNSELDDTDQDYRGKFGYRINPRAGIAADAGFTIDSRRDRDLEDTGLVLSSEERERQHYSLSGDYTFSEKTASALSYAYDQEDSDDPEFMDVRYHGASLGFTHNLSRSVSQTVGRFNAGYNRYDYAGIEIDKYSCTFGASHELSELFTVLVDLGARYSESEIKKTTLSLNPETMVYEYVQYTDEDDDWGAVVQAVLSYNSDLSGASLTAGHDLKPASGRRGASERTSVSLSMSKGFRDKLRVSLTAGYHLNKSNQNEFGLQDIDEQSWSVRPSARYNFSRDMSLEASYGYTKVEDKEDDTDPERNAVSVRFFWQYPLFDE